MTDSRKWGAGTRDWRLFCDLGLTEDLLPVVSNPGAETAPSSSMKSVGKTPSLYNNDGYAVGIAKWTTRHSTKAEVEKWAAEGDYGICLQTRQVRALDIDVDDKRKAKVIEDFIYEALGYKLPLRYRTNSGKKLLAFRLPSVLSKRVMKVEGGIIEFLATGQQFIAGGEHPSGARYTWDWHDYDDFPKLAVDEFEDLWFMLTQQFALEAPKEKGVRRGEDDAVVTDKVVQALEEKGLITHYGDEGQGFLDCPFSHEHTQESSPTATAYFPAGSRGYEQGHFVCLHAHCQGRADNAFKEALGVFEDEMELIPAKTAESGEEVAMPPFQRTKNGNPYATLDNVVMAVGRLDIATKVPHYDIFRDEIVFQSASGWHRASDKDYIDIRLHLERRHGFLPIGRELMRDAVTHVAYANETDTAISWLNSLQWDGKSRVRRFLCDYFGAAENEYHEAVSLYLWTGLAGRVLEPGLKADMIPIAKGNQGLKKTSLIEAIAPTPDEFCEINFSARDDDLSRLMRGVLVAEIAELQGMKTKALEGIKAFVSRRFERWVPKYKEFSITFPRRLMFIATTNEEHFLTDPTGNRRWLPFLADRDADPARIIQDRAQLWAEAKVLFEIAGLCFEKAERLAVLEHDKYTVSDPWTDTVRGWLYRAEDLDGQKRPVDRDYIQSSDAFREALNMEPRSITRFDEMKMAEVLKRLGFNPSRRYVEGGQSRVWVRV